MIKKLFARIKLIFSFFLNNKNTGAIEQVYKLSAYRVDNKLKRKKHGNYFDFYYYNRFTKRNSPYPMELVRKIGDTILPMPVFLPPFPHPSKSPREIGIRPVNSPHK